MYDLRLLVCTKVLSVMSFQAVRGRRPGWSALGRTRVRHGVASTSATTLSDLVAASTPIVGPLPSLLQEVRCYGKDFVLYSVYVGLFIFFVSYTL